MSLPSTTCCRGSMADLRSPATMLFCLAELRSTWVKMSEFLAVSPVIPPRHLNGILLILGLELGKLLGLCDPVNIACTSEYKTISLTIKKASMYIMYMYTSMPQYMRIKIISLVSVSSFWPCKSSSICCWARRRWKSPRDWAFSFSLENSLQEEQK